MSDFNGSLDLHFDQQAGYYDEEEEELPRKLPVIPANGRHVTTQQVEESVDDES